jgi:hypothetical protein
MATTDSMAEAGRTVVTRAAATGITLRLLGGVAVWTRSSSDTRAALGRPYGDLDFVSHGAKPSTLTDLLAELGYAEERRFNAVHGERRLLYNAVDGTMKVDVFRERFEMCHTLDLRGRVSIDELTLPAADLALTKLQVAELTEKDLIDTYMLLLDHTLGNVDEPSVLNVDRILDVCSKNWGWYTTVTDNLATATRLAPDILTAKVHRVTVADRLTDLLAALEAAPKSLAWKARAKVGRRVAWHESPGEVEQ